MSVPTNSAHYSIAKASVVTPLPETISFETGCVLPRAFYCGHGTLSCWALGASVAADRKPRPIDTVVLVWGGSSSTGSAGIQLAVASGLAVIATASEGNHRFVKSLGASAVFDYRKGSIIQDLIQAIKETPGEFVGALDAIGEDKTWRACTEVVEGLGGGRVVSNLPAGFTDVPESAEVVGVNDTAHLASNKGIVEGVWGRFVSEGFKNGCLRRVPEPLVVGKGLEKIPEGVDLCRQGISAGKVVVAL